MINLEYPRILRSVIRYINNFFLQNIRMLHPKLITNQNNQSIESIENDFMTYCDELALEVSSSYYTGYIDGTCKKSIQFTTQRSR